MAYDAHNPDHMFLGTSTGQLFVSNDGGHSWAHIARLGGDDYVLDHIAIDPKDSNHIYVSAWSVSSQQIGEVFRSHDGGHNWETSPAMHGKSVRALAIFPANTKVMVAGALDGVYRSNDGGANWERISPANHADIKNIESVAIDPKDPNVVYAGTWHLAWKTADGGANWQHINKGMIDDSDVFSIIVDHDNASVVFASACSGIYKSESAGASFTKIQGIPFSARRTRVLKQDPTNENIVYAGTTEGLWKTMDLGKSWKRVSNPELVVNDILVDPRDSNHVLLATDRSGVMASNDGAATWTTSNHGYTHRYVSAILADKKENGTFYVGVVNDREYGGVFYTRDNGQHWLQKSAGLGGRDVFALKQADNGTLVAGTNRGIFALDRSAGEWRSMNNVITEESVKTARKGSKKATFTTVSKKSELEARVNDLELGSEEWFAATSAGIYHSSDQGKTWKGGAFAGQSDFVAVRADGNFVVVATRNTVMTSENKGSSWRQATIPSYVLVRGLALAGGTIMVASREGAFRSEDRGQNWMHVGNGLPDKDITSVKYDPSRHYMLATSDSTGVIFESADNGRTWHRGPDTGYPLRRVGTLGGRYVAATPFDGVVVQPENGNMSAAAGDGGSN